MDEKKENKGSEDKDKPAVDLHAEKVKELNRKCAQYRTQRNNALRRSHGAETMLKAHGISTSPLDGDALKNLPIDSGKVDGVFDYKPPAFKEKHGGDPKTAGPPSVSGNSLSHDILEKMPASEVNKRWGEIKTFLSKGG